MKLLFIFCVLILNCSHGYGWRIFHRGRLFGGNLKFSAQDNEVLSLDPNIKEKWFTQLLDHFNPTDTTTWQQVQPTFLVSYL